MKKVGRNVYGSGDTIVTKTSHFFQGLTLGAEGGGACTRYFTVYSKDLNVYLFLYDNFISNFLIFLISGPHTLLMVMVCVLNNFVVCDYS